MSARNGSAVSFDEILCVERVRRYILIEILQDDYGNDVSDVVQSLRSEQYPFSRHWVTVVYKCSGVKVDDPINWAKEQAKSVVI